MILSRDSCALLGGTIITITDFVGAIKSKLYFVALKRMNQTISAAISVTNRVVYLSQNCTGLTYPTQKIVEQNFFDIIAFCIYILMITWMHSLKMWYGVGPTGRSVGRFRFGVGYPSVTMVATYFCQIYLNKMWYSNKKKLNYSLVHE